MHVVLDVNVSLDDRGREQLIVIVRSEAHTSQCLALQVDVAVEWHPQTHLALSRGRADALVLGFETQLHLSHTWAVCTEEAYVYVCLCVFICVQLLAEGVRRK